MKKKTIEVHSGLPLAAVLRELAEKLIADDWVRYATSDGGSVFYIVGVNAHAADQEGTLEYLSLSVPPGSKVTAIGEREVHAQVASRKPAEYYHHAVSCTASSEEPSS